MTFKLKMLMVLACLLLPLNVFAMKHGDMSSDSMNMGGKSISLGQVDVEGVQASAYLLDVGGAMAKHGMKTTHHLMIKFADIDSGKHIAKGRAAVKVTDAAGRESKAFKMMKMDGAFGTDLTLDQQGPYKFKVGTKLSDGGKRTFNFQFDN